LLPTRPGNGRCGNPRSARLRVATRIWLAWKSRRQFIAEPVTARTQRRLLWAFERPVLPADGALEQGLVGEHPGCAADAPGDGPGVGILTGRGRFHGVRGDGGADGLNPGIPAEPRLPGRIRRRNERRRGRVQASQQRADLADRVLVPRLRVRARSGRCRGPAMSSPGPVRSWWPLAYHRLVVPALEVYGAHLTGCAGSIPGRRPPERGAGRMMEAAPSEGGGRACGFSLQAAPGTWAGTSSGS
jgi:hypothetical protein